MLGVACKADAGEAATSLKLQWYSDGLEEASGSYAMPYHTKAFHAHKLTGHVLSNRGDQRLWTLMRLNHDPLTQPYIPEIR